MPKIVFSLNPDSINKAIRELKAYTKKVQSAPENAMKTAVEDGVHQAKELAMYMNAYDSGELVNGIVAEYEGNKGYIHSTAPHTAFVEMGTGIRGAGEPHPENYYPGWEYDVNEHGEAGWYYIGRDGKRHWTKGMPSRPFLYETSVMLKDAIPGIVENELKKR